MSESTSSEIDKGDRIVYDGGRNPSYDLTGKDPRFKKEYEFVSVFQSGQIHTFPIPVYLDKIEVKKIVNGNTTTVNHDETGAIGTWKVHEVDVDAMSKAYLLDTSGTFDKTLVKSIELNLVADSASTTKVMVNIVTQRFYLDLYDLNRFDGVGPSYTPGFGRWIMDELQELKARVATNFINTFSATGTANNMLDEDVTGTKPENYIQDESHEINVVSGVDTLMPARGSFYAHDFRMYQYSVRTGTVQMANKKYNLENQAIFVYTELVTVGSTTSQIATVKRVYLTEQNYDDYIGMAGSFIDRAKLKLLANGVDYEFTNLNVAKTEKSESEYGVYDTIRMLTPLCGNVLITYRAFGGNVVFQDVYDMRQDILSTLRILSSKTLVTSDILDKQPVIRDMLNRIQLVEQYHNHFNRVEHAIYRGQKGFHWFDIATLYNMPWEDSVPVTDEIGTFRVESLDRKWCYEFSLSIDLKKRLVDMMRCKTLATNDVYSYELKDYNKYLSNRDDVAIRVLWVGDGTASGIVLQLGWNFENYVPTDNGVDTDTLVVTNKSGMTSNWRLIYNALDNTYDSDASIKYYNHVRYVTTSDATYLADKKYFEFQRIYTYYKTNHTYVKEGVQYFTLQTNAIAGTSEYVDVTSNLFVGQAIADYTSQAAYKNGIYERVVYKSVPKLIPPSSYTVGNPIELRDEVFEASNGSYSEDTMTQMPKPSCTWMEGTTGCYQLRQLLEPSDGVVAWVGNYPLHQLGLITSQGHSQCLTSFLRLDTQKIVDVNTVKGMTLRLYDRKLDRIITRTVDVGLDEAQYESVQTGDTASPNRVYYELMRGVDSENHSYVLTPVKYVRSKVVDGAVLTPGVHFVAKRRNGTLYNGTSSAVDIVHSDRIVGQAIVDLLDLCGVCVEFYKITDEHAGRNMDGQLRFRLTAFLGTDSVINERFDLRQIELHF